MKRTALHFDIRGYSEISLADMADKVGAALGCSFREGKLNDTEAYVAEILGLRVSLYDWRGLDSRVVFVLSSTLVERRLRRDPGGERFDLDIQEIGPAVADLLTVRTGLEWRPVRPDEGAAEREHQSRVDQRIHRQEGEAASWGDQQYRLD